MGGSKHGGKLRKAEMHDGVECGLESLTLFTNAPQLQQQCNILEKEEAAEATGWKGINK
jgi:hypothetical protein